MDVSKIVGNNHFIANNIRIDKSSEHLIGAKSTKQFFAKDFISDNFPNINEETSSVEFSFSSFSEARKAARQKAVDAAVGENKKDLEMRMYWGDYCDIFSGGSPNGWRNLDMEKMYSQAADIFKQIEEGSDSEETKALKRQGLESALRTGTGMYKMRVVGAKMQADALEAEAQGKPVDRSYNSKAKFDTLSRMSTAFYNITSMFFNNLKNGNTDRFDYNAMISDTVNKIMSYKHPN